MTVIISAPERATREDCDRCGVRASSVATFPGGGELTFCGHHGREHRAQLLVAGAVLRPLG
jgi:hypothetical protein